MAAGPPQHPEALEGNALGWPEDPIEIVARVLAIPLPPGALLPVTQLDL